MPDEKLTRLSVNMNEETTKQLRALMDSTDASATEIVLAAVDMLHYLRDEVVSHSREIHIVDKRRNQFVVLDTWDWK